MLKTNLTLGSLILWLALQLCAVSSDAQPTVNELSEHLQAIADQSGLPGFAVAVLTAEGSRFQQGFGYADKQNKSSFDHLTQINVGSVSKVFVGVAVVKAIKAGKLTLDTEINSVLPFEVINPYYPEQPILLRHLLTHTSGIRDTKYYGHTYLPVANADRDGNHPGYQAFLDSHDVLELSTFLSSILTEQGDWYKKKNFAKSAPGKVRDYANLNAALAAYIVELAVGIPFDQYTQAEIFEPLGMRYTYWQLDQAPDSLHARRYFPAGAEVPYYRLITYPDGGLVSNVADLSLFLQEIIRAYGGTSEYLSEEEARMLLPGDGDEDRAFWGMGEQSRNIGHGGSDPGVQADVQFNADSRIGRIILCNVNAEDNEELWASYRELHLQLAQFEKDVVMTTQ